MDLGLNDPVFSGGEQTLIDRTVIGRWALHLKTYRVSIKVNVPATEGCFESSGTYTSAGLEQVCCTFI